MERAVFLDTPGSIPSGSWSRLYYGSEFCSWTFPETDSLKRALATARAASLPFTLVTPVLSEPFIPVLRRRLLQLLPQLADGDELVVSDLGTLPLLTELGCRFPVIIGRPLSGQKRGPRILDLELNQAEQEYFRKGSWYQREAVSWLTEQGVERVELDNLLQGIAPLPSGLHGSLHLPYAMVTSSRNCPYREPGQFGPCAGGCGKPMRLQTAETSEPLYQAGNSQFLKIAQEPLNLPALGIDRVVEHMRIPR